jgi:hypothetical protein
MSQNNLVETLAMNAVAEAAIKSEVLQRSPYSVAIASTKVEAGRWYTHTMAITKGFISSDEATGFGYTRAMSEYPLDQGYTGHAISVCKDPGAEVAPGKKKFAISIASQEGRYTNAMALFGQFSSKDEAMGAGLRKADTEYPDAKGFDGKCVDVVEVPENI